MTRLKLALTVMAALALAATWAAGRSSMPAVADVPKEAGFDDTWREAAVTVALKSASLRNADPKPVATLRIAPEAPVSTPPVIAAPVVAAAPIEAKAPRRRRHIARRDVCARHGLRKVSIRGGRSWRCRR
ncbi:hypothetical protein [Bradyrhizobium sp. USDA 10063]